MKKVVQTKNKNKALFQMLNCIFGKNQESSAIEFIAKHPNCSYEDLAKYLSQIKGVRIQNPNLYRIALKLEKHNLITINKNNTLAKLSVTDTYLKILELFEKLEKL